MKIGIISDTHLEHAFWDFEEQEGVFYIHAGDIGGHMTRDYLLEKHPDMFYIYGNHDYYGKHGIDFRESTSHKKEQVVNGIKIRGATLWTQINTELEWRVYCGNLADFSHIKNLNAFSYQIAHDVHKQWMFDSDADVLVMHHAPSFESTSPKYKGDPINMFFATELSNVILSMKKPPKLVIHGHMHNKSDYMIGKTRVICHPRGYPNENPWFSTYEPLIVEI
jgi:predicted phosphodiesterase